MTRAESHKRWREKNREHWNQLQRNWTEKNPEKVSQRNKRQHITRRYVKWLERQENSET